MYLIAIVHDIGQVIRLRPYFGYYVYVYIVFWLVLWTIVYMLSMMQLLHHGIVYLYVAPTPTPAQFVTFYLFYNDQFLAITYIYISLISNTKSKLIAICDIILCYLLQEYDIMNTYKIYYGYIYLYILHTTHNLLICVLCIMNYLLLCTYQIRRYNGESA